MVLNEWDNCKRVCLQQNNNDTIPRSITLENSCKPMTNDQSYYPSPYALSQLSIYERVGARTDSLRRQHTYDVPIKKVGPRRALQQTNFSFSFTGVFKYL